MNVIIITARSSKTIKVGSKVESEPTIEHPPIPGEVAAQVQHFASVSYWFY